MPRTRPNVIQNFLSGVLLPLLSISLLPISLAAVAACMLLDKFKGGHESRIVSSVGDEGGKKNGQGCVIISGGRMSKGLTYVSFTFMYTGGVLMADWLGHSRELDGK
jgi:hypothetical protein